MRNLPLLLASASPRRSQILQGLGLAHTVVPAGVEETPFPGEEPFLHVERLARLKAAQGAEGHPEAWVLAGDTIVVLDGQILGKPRDEAEAEAMLLRLQGRVHRVLSALALSAPRGDAAGLEPSLISGVSVTAVRFRPFDPTTARAYVETGEPMDKAGAYGIQGLGATLVEEISGDHSGVVGLPISLLLRLLDQGGRPYHFPERIDVPLL